MGPPSGGVVLAALSDTHIPSRAAHLPAALLQLLAEVQPELILHAGDILVAEVLDELAALAPVEAVAGNMDAPGLRRRLGRRRVVQAGGHRIGLVHGDARGRPPLEEARLAFADEGAPPEVVVFGHSHRALVTRADGLLLVNPGSPTVPRPGPPSVALITAGPRGLKAEIVPLQ